MNSWDKLSNDEKMDALTKVLTRAGSDMSFRQRCLASSESARQAVAEATGIDFPPDFVIEFVSPEDRMKRLILTMPDYIAPESGVAEVRNVEDFQTCSYMLWRA